jgi:hypothetical protein
MIRTIRKMMKKKRMKSRSAKRSKKLMANPSWTKKEPIKEERPHAAKDSSWGNQMASSWKTKWRT